MRVGEISVEFHNKKIQYIKHNQLLAFNPNQVHVCKSTKVDTCDYFTFHFDRKWLKNISSNTYFDKNIIEDKYIYEEFMLIATKASVKKNIFIEEKLSNLMKKILKKFGQNELNNNNEKNNILLDVRKYILKNIEEQITLEDIAYEVGYSKEHIVRIFKKEFGLTPHAFLMNEKVNKAKDILQNTNDKNISQLAIDLGFYDQSHFVKYFKKSHAITPSSYKIG